MSWQEYESMYERAQRNNKAPYKTFVLDVVGSKKISREARHQLQDKLMLVEKLMRRDFYDVIVFDDRCPINGIVDGDGFAFTFLAGTVSEDQFLNVFVYYLSHQGISQAFHFASANVETVHWAEGGNLYYDGYAIAKLLQDKQMKRRTIYVESC